MPNQDFSTYTELDPNGRYTVTSSKITAINLQRDEDAYIYEDFGVDFFTGSWTHIFSTKRTANDIGGRIQSLSYQSVVDDTKGLTDASEDAIYVRHWNTAGSLALQLVETSGGAGQADTFVPTLNVQYWYILTKDMGASANGDVDLFIYDDSARTNLVDTLNLSLAVDNDFRYLFAVNSWNSGDLDKISLFVENLNLFITPDSNMMMMGI